MSPCLGDLVDIVGGGTPSKSVPEYWGGSIPWASVKDFKTSELVTTDDYITELGVKNSSTRVIPAGNIIVPTRMALGKVAVNRVDVAINQDLKALLVKDDSQLYKPYLLRFLESKAKKIEGHGKGATVKGITLNVLRELEIPLPPLDEQKRIAAILDKADAIRRKRQQAIQLADEFLRATFLVMFGDPVMNPKGWKKLSIDEVTLDIKTWSPSSSENDFVFHYIDLSSLDNNKKEITNISEVTTTLAPSRARQLTKKGDVLVSTVRPNLNGVARVYEDIDHLTASTGYCVLRPLNELVTQNFIFYTVTSNSFISEMVNRASGANYPAVTNRIVKSYQFELPPKELLIKFEEICDSVMSYIKAAHASSEQALFPSLSQKAFSEEL